MPCEPESRCAFTLYPRVAADDDFTHVVYSQIVFTSGNSKFRCPKHEKTFDHSCQACNKGKMADNFRRQVTCPAACNVYVLPAVVDGIQTSRNGVRLLRYEPSNRSSWEFEMEMIGQAMDQLPDGARVLVLTGSRLWERADTGGRHPAQYVGQPEAVLNWSMRFDHLVFDVLVGSQCVPRSRELAHSCFVAKNPVGTQTYHLKTGKVIINTHGVYTGYRNTKVNVGSHQSVPVKRLKKVDESKKGEFRKDDYFNDLSLVMLEKDDDKAEALLDMFECSLESYFGRGTLSMENAEWCRQVYKEAADKVKFRDASYMHMFDLLCIRKPDDALKFAKKFLCATQESISRFLSFRSDLDVNKTMEILLPFLTDDE